MIKIIPVRHSDIKKIVEMIEYVSPELSSGVAEDMKFTPFPLNIMHKMLPLELKFLQEAYVAIEDNQPLGLINLVPDGHTRTRWKINRLVLGIDAYDIGKQLIDYVVNRFGGAGVETFLTVINENSPEAIALFKNASSFRDCSKLNIWECEDFHVGDTLQKCDFIRPVSAADSQKLLELDSEALLPHLRPSLGKTVKDFRFDVFNRLTNRLKGYKTEKYVLDNPNNNSIDGLLSIQTVDVEHFWVDITLNLAYQEYYEDLLVYAIRNIRKQNKEAKIYLGVKGHYQTGKFVTEFLKSQNMKLCGDFLILVKDYWKPLREKREQSMPIVAFPDMTSPACNITPFIMEV